MLSLSSELSACVFQRARMVRNWAVSAEDTQAHSSAKPVSVPGWSHHKRSCRLQAVLSGCRVHCHLLLTHEAAEEN